MKHILLAGLLLLLAGCKVEMEIPIAFSDLETKEVLTKSLFVLVEVPTCKDYEDTRNESKSLIDLKEKVAAHFPIAKYSQCFSKKMNSFAEYKLPFSIIPKGMKFPKEAGDKLSETSVGVIRLKDAKIGEAPITDVQLFFFNTFKKQLNQFAEDNYTSLSATIHQILTNDLSEKRFYYISTPVYVDGYAYEYIDELLAKGDKSTITLSNVSADLLMLIPDNEAYAKPWSITVGTEEAYKKATASD